MGDNSAIEWTDATWNPVRGCRETSPGCDHCYARTFSERWRGINGHPYEAGFDPRFVPDQLEIPLRWKRPRTIFVNSMSDLFQGAFSNEEIAAVYGVMAATPRHTYQCLTKRSTRLPLWHGWVAKRQREGLQLFPHDSPEWRVRQMLRVAALRVGCGGLPQVTDDPWPLSNVWQGVSVESPEYLSRIDDLRAVPATVRFLSLEPLLADLGTIDLTGIHWVITGGESGPRARPMNLDWVRSIRDQCAAAGVPFFHKQHGGVLKKKTGRELDGRTHDEMPARAA